MGYSFFDSEKEIPRSLDPVYKHVHKIYAINGRFALFKSDHDFSIDGSERALSKYPNVVLDNYTGHQTDKRQRYFDLAGEDNCDFLLVLDSDEYIHPDYQDWKHFYRQLEKYSKKYPEENLFFIKIFLSKDWDRNHNDVRRGYFRKYVRLHRNPGNQRYALGCHYFFSRKCDTDEEIAKEQKPLLNWNVTHTIDGVRLKIDSTLRTSAYMKNSNGWAFDTKEDEEKFQYFTYCKYVNPKILDKYPHLRNDPMLARV